MTKAKRTWARHVALMGEFRNTYEILSKNLKGRYHLGGVGVEGSVILKLIFKKLVARLMTGFSRRRAT